MSLVQMQYRSTSAASVHSTAADAMDTGGPQVCDDMTVEVALSVMAGARTGHLLVCDNDDLCTALLTQAQLTAARDSSAYTDRVQLRDILGDRGRFAHPVGAMDDAEYAMGSGGLDALHVPAPIPAPVPRPVVDEHGGVPGALALAFAR
ncbi:hypothetical protein [Streptomyces sp. NPDC018045]|uniref:hypothetical protein n=1 Tax=Streptomyces sp. NPDC018045 TaxID=3365037 RepID=UPI0037B93A0C